MGMVDERFVAGAYVAFGCTTPSHVFETRSTAVNRNGTDTYDTCTSFSKSTPAITSR